MSPYRRNGEISTIQGTKLITHFMCIDTETTDKRITDYTTEFIFKCGVVIYGEFNNFGDIINRRVERFITIGDMLSYISFKASECKVLYLFGHNIGFDLRVIGFFDYINSEDYNSEPPIINERIFIFTAHKKGSKIIVLDTANYAVQTVKKLGDDIGLPKLDVNFSDVSLPDLLEYCERDTEIVFRFISTYIKFIADNDLGGFKTTLASQSLQAWRHRFIDIPVWIHSNKLAIELERKAYHGGRVECYRIGQQKKQTYYNLDINSMYPFIMSTIKLPYMLKEVSNDNRPFSLARWSKGNYCISELEITTQTPCYPLFANNRLIFPIGTFNTVLHDAEIQYALENNHIKSVKKTYIYSASILFKNYVDFFYAIKVSSKLTNNSSWEFIAKIFLNSLYGKFGQTNVERKHIGQDNSKAIWRIPWSHIEQNIHGQMVCWFGNIINEVKQGETSFSFPALAGAITAASRMLLWKYIELAGFDNVFYVDTDSLMVNEQGYNNLDEHISETTLGKLKVVGTTDNLLIRGCKDYVFGDIDKTKGKSKEATTLETDKWQQLQFESVVAWINRGGIGGPRGTIIIKNRSNKYEKGIVQSSGCVSPFKF